ncbi:MAG TPA: hypothetical protein VGB98_15615, partial [Pyrinomonadaceae bacterium]
KAFVGDVGPRDVRLVTVEELFQAFRTSVDSPPGFERAEFEAALKGLESLGLLRLFDFGGLVTLRPEALQAAAGEIISAADREGMLAEEEI